MLVQEFHLLRAQVSRVFLDSLVMGNTFFAECLSLGRGDAVQPCAGGGLDLGLTTLAADAGLFGGAKRRSGRVHGGGFCEESYQSQLPDRYV